MLSSNACWTAPMESGSGTWLAEEGYAESAGWRSQEEMRSAQGSPWLYDDE